jgi:hypothetical protein
MLAAACASVHRARCWGSARTKTRCSIASWAVWLPALALQWRWAVGGGSVGLGGGATPERVLLNAIVSWSVAVLNAVRRGPEAGGTTPCRGLELSVGQRTGWAAREGRTRSLCCGNACASGRPCPLQQFHQDRMLGLARQATGLMPETLPCAFCHCQFSHRLPPPQTTCWRSAPPSAALPVLLPVLAAGPRRLLACTACSALLAGRSWPSSPTGP